jgi:hypothetical protein
LLSALREVKHYCAEMLIVQVLSLSFPYFAVAQAKHHRPQGQHD